MKDTFKNLALIRKNVLVIDLKDPIKSLDIEGDSKNPDLIILNGTVSEEIFKDAESKISSGGLIAFTRGNSRACNNVKQAVDLYGDAYKVIASCAKRGKYLCVVKNVLIYVKGIKGIEYTGANDWSISKSKEVLDNLLFHNLGSLLSKAEYEKPLEDKTESNEEEIVEEVAEEVEEPKEERPKRKRRTKEEMKAAKQEG